MPYVYEINVRDAPYNAVGDGVTDDSAAFQAAFAAAATVNSNTFGGISLPWVIGSGPVVVIPNGQYLISSAVTSVGAYIRVRGQDAILIGGDPTEDILVFQAHVQSIEGLTFVGGRYQINIAPNAQGSLYLTECKFFRPAEAAFHTNDSSNIGYFHFTRCVFANQVARAISGASNASPIVVSTGGTAHGLLTGQRVSIAGVTGNTNANNTSLNPDWTITKIDDFSFSLNGSTGNAAYVAGGVIADASSMILCESGDEVELNQCHMTTCQSRPVVMTKGAMIVRDLFATPNDNPFGVCWFTITNAHLRVT